MKRPGVRLRRWKSPAHFRRTSTSSRSRSSQLVLPSRIKAASSPTSLHMWEPHLAFLTFSNLLAFLPSARSLASSERCVSPLRLRSMPASVILAFISSESVFSRRGGASVCPGISLATLQGRACGLGCDRKIGATKWQGACTFILNHLRNVSVFLRAPLMLFRPSLGEALVSSGTHLRSPAFKCSLGSSRG